MRRIPFVVVLLVAAIFSGCSPAAPAQVPSEAPLPPEPPPMPPQAPPAPEDPPEPPQQAGSRPVVVSIAAGATHACARIADGTVRCWGANHSRQLGDGTKRHRELPVVVKDLAGVKELTVGGYHACAELTAGGVKCWGWNPEGQLGDGTFEDRPTPVLVPSSSAANGALTKLALGDRHSCALAAGGTTKCWGNDVCGQLGNGERFLSGGATAPLEVPGLRGVVEVATGDQHTCARLADGALFCWGGNEAGQLGSPATDANPHGVTRMSPPAFPALTTRERMTPWSPCPASSKPARAPAIANVEQLALGSGHTCARSKDGTVRCFGSYHDGGSSSADRFAATAVPGLTDAVSIASHGDVACALRREGSVVCWGRIGPALVVTPAPVPGIANAKALALGGEFGCALLGDGNVRCWGRVYQSSGKQRTIAIAEELKW